MARRRPVVTGDDNHSQPAQLRSILGRHPKTAARQVEPGPRPWAEGGPGKKWVASRDITCCRRLVVPQTGSAKGSCQSPHRGIKSDSRGHSAPAKWCCTYTKGARTQRAPLKHNGRHIIYSTLLGKDLTLVLRANASKSICI